MGMAFAEARAGQIDSAIARLEYLSTIPSPLSVAVLKDEPMLGAIKQDPRFTAILERGDKAF